MLENNKSNKEMENSYEPLLQYIEYLYYENQCRTRFQYKLSDHTLGIYPTFVIGICGPVSVGKSTMATLLLKYLNKTMPHIKIKIISIDDFLYSNQELIKKGLMQKKGFPSTYKNTNIINFLKDIKYADAPVEHYIYSHELSDIDPDRKEFMNKPDILIIEGINILQLPVKGIVPISDYVDLSIYIDSNLKLIREWYIERFFEMVRLNKNRPRNFFYKWNYESNYQAKTFAMDIWNKVNLPNIEQNILPTKSRADIVIHLGKDHIISQIEF